MPTRKPCGYYELIENDRMITLMPRLLAITLLFISAIPSCSTTSNSRTAAQPSGPAAAVQTRTFVGTGFVSAVKIESSVIELNHDEIEGLMPAMKMEFHVKDRSLLSGLTSGDRVEFTVENGVGGIIITAVKKI
jgi:Cu(I)/Ag(I) efflux system periplasmic protein CusF